MKIKFASLSAMLFYFIFFFADIVFSEWTVRLFTLGAEAGFPVFLHLFAIAIAFLLAAITAACKKRVRTVVSFVFTALLFLLYIVQLVYYTFCDSFMSIIQVAMGGDALANFGEAAKLVILESLGGILLLLLPVLVLLVLSAKGLPRGQAISWKWIPAELAIFLALHFGAVACLPMGGDAIYSPYDVYHETFVLGMSERHFGVLTSLRLELRGLLFGTGDNDIILIPEQPLNTDPPVTEDDDPLTPPAIEYEYNYTDIDFDALMAETEDEGLLALHKYFSAQQGTKQNAYTGMFKGYNLIFLCAESFSHHLIDAERTPVLYRMATEGFRFSDYYNSVCDNTSNGEYALLTGLLPDTSLLGKGWKTFYNYNSFTAAQENALPFALGNQFSALGYTTYAIHNYNYNYYNRHKTHPNLGYTWKAMYRGLEVVDDWPTSDVSMFEQTLPELLTADESGAVAPFHAYFLTFSGHMPYTFGYNTMADKNKPFTDGMPYSNKVKCYLAAQQELEYALSYLLYMLEEANVLDNTLIVLTNDHYPYPLGLDYLGELAGREMDAEFDKYASDLLIWSASMEEPIPVDVPCCSLDVLPTLLNLFGLPYDSRLLMGTDVLANGDHIAILADRSFVTDKVKYNCTNGEVTLREGVTELPEGYLDGYIAAVKNKFTLSTEILYSDYYREIYGE